jgi:hypothetical protein
MILIHPPVVKPSEPPPGVAKLAGAMRAHGIPCRVVDANIEGLLHLLREEQSPSDTWGKRAAKNLSRNLKALRQIDTYRSIDLYRRTVIDVNKVLEMAGTGTGTFLSLANYRQNDLVPVKSSDLITAAEKPERNPFYPYFTSRLRTLIEEEATALVGFSLNYLSQALCTFAMIGFIKREYPGLSVVVGGGLATSWMRKPGWDNPFRGLVDHWVAGPGERPLIALAGGRDNSQISQFPSAPHFESLPMKDYFSPGPILPYSASVGCYWNKCAFCPERAEGNPYQRIPDHRVTAELAALTERIRPSMIHIVDNALSPALMNALAVTPPGAPWYGFARITEELADPDFCRSLRKSGCVMLKVGLESGDQKVIESMGKGINLHVASRALQAMNKEGIKTYVYLLFGTPSEGPEEARKTLHFTAHNSNFIDFLNVAIFNLPALAPDVESLDTSQFYEGDLSLYRDFVHPKGWNRRLVRQFLDREFKRNPAISPIIRRDPPIFTSNHAPFF